MVTFLNIARRVTRFNESAIVLVFGLLLAPCAQAQLRISPVNPAWGSMIRIEGISGCFGAPVEISVQGYSGNPGGAVIKVFDPGWLDTPLMPCPPGIKNYVEYGPVSMGTYRVEHYRRITSAPPDRLLGTLFFTVTGGNNLGVPTAWNGNWWSPGESGWAINIERDPTSGNIFMAWYTHEQQAGIARPVWIVAPNLTQVQSVGSPTRLTGELYRAQGSRGLINLAGSPIPPAFSMTAQSVGTVTLEFTALDRMTLSYSISTNGGTIVSSSTPGALITGSALLQKFTY